MKTLRVLNSYSAYVGTSIITKLPKLIDIKKYSKVFLITDTNVKKYLLKTILQIIPDIKVIVIESGEKTKNIETVKEIWNQLYAEKCDRKSLIINLGGGVVGDLGGFAASTYMRGVDFLQLPTTLLSQVDSSVGGKTGINFAGVKNLIGSFNQPIAVICDISFLSTLPEREFVAGFGEIIKHGLISNRNYFNFVSSKKPTDFSKQELAEIIFTSIKIKSSIITGDEKESDKRMLVNFGHTAGHAIESLCLETPAPLLHGEAVSIGIVIEARISQIMGLISEAQVTQIKIALKQANLPVISPNLGVKDILEVIKSDKKTQSGETKWTLLRDIGQAVVNQKVSEEVIRRAYENSKN